MNTMTKKSMQATGERRTFLRSTGGIALSGAAVALLGGCETMAASQAAKGNSTDNDVEILNVALGLEHEAINAYQIGAESGLLEQGVLDTAVLFQSQHKTHRDVLVSTIQKLGGRPVEAKTQQAYAEALNAGTLSNQVDVVELAAKLELGAANAYLGVIPSFGDDALAKVAGRLAADETMHWTVLSQALGRALPQQALTFGA